MKSNIKTAIKYIWIGTFIIMGIGFINNTSYTVGILGKEFGLIFGVLILVVLFKDLVSEVLALINRNKK